MNRAKATERIAAVTAVATTTELLAGPSIEHGERGRQAMSVTTGAAPTISQRSAAND